MLEHGLDQAMKRWVMTEALPHHPSVLHDHQLIGQQGQPDVVQDCEQGGSLRLQTPHLFEPIHLVGRIQVREWFVHQHHGCLAGQETGEKYPLAFASREFRQHSIAEAPRLCGLQSAVHELVV
jgi:hypothetical protein